MRKFLLSIFFVAIAVLGMAQTHKVRTNPDEADFYIKGDLSIEEINGKVVYKLSKVESQGIYFENKTIREGFETDKEDVLFQFSRARVDLPHTLDDTLDFWRYDKAIDEWQPDGETRQGTAGVETKKSAVIMLVIDCSGSIGKDFNKVQNAAQSFVDYVYNKTNGIGNIKMGIIGFSKMNETVENVFEITPLTSQSRSEMIRFINNLTTQSLMKILKILQKAL